MYIMNIRENIIIGWMENNFHHCCVRIVLSPFSCVQLFETPWTVACSVHGILQARILEWVAIPFSR